MTEDLAVRLRALPSFPAELPVLAVDAAPLGPEALFLDWLEDAASHGVLAPHAAVLSTADATGPSGRVLILKDLDERGWAFATPADSRPGLAVMAGGRAALTFFWPARGRQVRVEGTVVRADAEESAADFRARPAAARATAAVGRPTATLASEELYDAVRATALARTEQNPDAVPAARALWRLQAEKVEFWQARHDRAHLRLRYRPAASGASAAGWITEQLWP